MACSTGKYCRKTAEKRFARIYETVEGDQCIYCGMPSDGKYDHQPPVFVLHRFANGGPVTKREIREEFGACKLVPCCTICNMGLGAYHGSDVNDRREEIVNWFFLDDRFPEDREIFDHGSQLIKDRIEGKRCTEIYEFPSVGRVIYIHALVGLIRGLYETLDDFPEWLKVMQLELGEWLRSAPRLKRLYFLQMAGLESYDLLPHARSDPRGQ